MCEPFGMLLSVLYEVERYPENPCMVDRSRSRKGHKLDQLDDHFTLYRNSVDSKR